MAITDWPTTERPREKLLQRGANALSDAELLAIILRNGIQGMSAVDLARSLLMHHGSLRRMLSSDQKTLCAHKGLGPAAYVQLKAIVEVGKRYARETLEQGQTFSSASDTREYLNLLLRDKPHEEFHILYLNAQHQLIFDELLFRGTIDSAAVYPREVVKRALHHNAAAVILAHNHPSGIAEPSQADEMITRRLSDALKLVDIRILDHQIVGEAKIVSLAERGIL